MFTYLSCSTRRALVVLCSLLTSGCTPAPQRVVELPDPVVGLAPPPVFELAPDFSGFVSEDGRSSILIAELPAQASDTVGALSADETTDTRALRRLRRACEAPGISRGRWASRSWRRWPPSRAATALINGSPFSRGRGRCLCPLGDLRPQTDPQGAYACLSVGQVASAGYAGGESR